MTVVLVEGPGDRPAVPVLIQRHRGTAVHCVDMKGKSNIVRKRRGFEDTIRRQHALGHRAFIVLMDGDVTSAPYQTLVEERSDMPHRARSLAQDLQAQVYISVGRFWSWNRG